MNLLCHFSSRSYFLRNIFIIAIEKIGKFSIVVNTRNSFLKSVSKLFSSVKEVNTCGR